MAQATNLTSSGLLKTAGIAPDAYSDFVGIEATNTERFRPIIESFGDAIQLESGEDLYIPIVARRTAITIYSKLDNGTTFTAVTNNKGQDITSNPETGLATQLNEKWESDTAFFSKMDWQKMSASKKQAYMRALGIQMAAALGEKRDADVASLANPALVPAANQINAAAPANITFEDVGAIVQRMIELKQRPPFVMGLPANQFSVMYNNEKFVRYNWTGIPGLIANDLVFRVGPMTIFCHNLAYDDAVDGKWGMAFGPGAVGFANLPVAVEDWYQEIKKSYFTSLDQQYAYGAIFDRVVVIQVPR